MNYDWLLEASDTIIPQDALEEKSESASISDRSTEVSSTSGSEEPIWTTANGDKIPLSKMENKHILNCIKLLESKGMFKNKWYRILNDELTRRRASKLEVSFSL